MNAKSSLYENAGGYRNQEEMNRLIRELDGILDSVWRAAKKDAKFSREVTLTGKDLEEYENATVMRKGKNCF